MSLNQEIALRMRAFITSHPILYFPTLRMRGVDPSFAVSRNTDILISGYGGSGNTYAAEAFEHVETDKKLAHHLHVPAQVIRAVNYGLPCLVLIRYPLDAIASVKSRFTVDCLDEELMLELHNYAHFYRSIIGLRQHYVSCSFSEIISHYPGVMDRVNKKFGTAFRVLENNDAKAADLRKRHKIKGVWRQFPVDEIKDFMRKPALKRYREAAESAYIEFSAVNGLATYEDPPRPITGQKHPAAPDQEAFSNVRE